jgi:hypothetical protein
MVRNWPWAKDDLTAVDMELTPEKAVMKI